MYPSILASANAAKNADAQKIISRLRPAAHRCEIEGNSNFDVSRQWRQGGLLKLGAKDIRTSGARPKREFVPRSRGGKRITFRNTPVNLGTLATGALSSVVLDFGMLKFDIALPLVMEDLSYPGPFIALRPSREPFAV